MRSALSRLLTVGVVAVVAVVGSFGGRALWDNVIAEDEPNAEPPPLEVLNDEAAKPKFEGEILGIFLAPHGVTVPDKFVSYDELCGSERSKQVDWEQAGEFGLSVTLPDPFKLDSNSLNTGVIACGDTVYAARWDYSALRPSGDHFSLVIARSPFDNVEFEASSERVETREIGGVEAIYIEPLSENGVGSRAGVIFPGESVITMISSEGVPVADLLEVAEIVAAASREAG